MAETNGTHKTVLGIVVRRGQKRDEAIDTELKRAADVRQSLQQTVDNMLKELTIEKINADRR